MIDLNQAIEKLKKLPPERQARLIREIDGEADEESAPASVNDEAPAGDWLELLRSHPIEGLPRDLSQNRAKFTGRGWKG